MELEAKVEYDFSVNIDNAILNYLEGKGDLGAIACECIVHTLKKGDCSPIQRLFQGLPADSREQKKFKTFLGHASRFTHENGEVVPTLALKDGKFSIRKNTHNFRVGMWDNAQALYDAMGNFLDWSPEKRSIDPNIEKLLRMVKSALTKAKDKAEEFGAKIPAGLDAEMTKLKDMIEVTLPQVKGIENAKVEA